MKVAASILEGQDAIRTSEDRLDRQLPGAHYEFTARQVAGDYALLIWQARSDHRQVDCGADSFVIRGEDPDADGALSPASVRLSRRPTLPLRFGVLGGGGLHDP